jgi:cytochrome P450
VRQRLNWLAAHGVVRASARLAARSGDPVGRLIADPQVQADPLPFCDELRPRGPLIPCLGGFLTVDHSAAQQVLRSEDLVTIQSGANLPAPLRWLERRTRDGRLHPMRPPSLIASEPPDHTRYRKAVSAVFTTRAVGTMRHRIRVTADALLDDLARDSCGGPIDIVDRYCGQLPVAVIGDILGVRECDREKVLRFGALAAPSLDVGLTWQQSRQVAGGLADFDTWLGEHLGRLRADPGDNLMSRLICASDADTSLSDAELRAVAGLVLVAGFETTVSLLGNGIRLLIDAPEQLALLRQDPELWPGAVDEVLRLDSPIHLSARMARSGTDVAGTPVKRGQTVTIHLAAANRDPAVFDEPSRFDVTRANAGRHLAFSVGRHFCLGSGLARAEGEVGLAAFFDRYPEASLAAAGVRRSTRVLHGWAKLPLRLSPAHAGTSINV